MGEVARSNAEVGTRHVAVSNGVVTVHLRIVGVPDESWWRSVRDPAGYRHPDSVPAPRYDDQHVIVVTTEEQVEVAVQAAYDRIAQANADWNAKHLPRIQSEVDQAEAAARDKAADARLSAEIARRLDERFGDDIIIEA